MSTLLTEIRKFLDKHRMAETRLGRLAVGDPNLVRDIRLGRQPRPDMQRRIREFLETYEGNVKS